MPIITRYSLLLIIVSITNMIGITAYAQTYNKVALVAVSTEYNEQQIPYINQVLKQAGYEVTDQYLHQVNSDLGYVNLKNERAQNLIKAMLDNKVDILWFVKGGGGALNILPLLKTHLKELQKAHPKVIIGFSDVTAIHIFVNKFLNWKSIHGVLAGLNKNIDLLMKNNNDPSISISKINSQQPIPSVSNLLKKGVHYSDLLPLSTKESIKGTLIGGNLTLFLSVLNTPFEPNLKGKILILEDVGDSYRQLDRNLTHLLLSHALKDVKGVIFGQFYPLDPTDADRLIYKKTLENFATAFKKPVYLFPYFGHGIYNKPFILDGKTNITCLATSDYCQLTNQ